MLITAIVLMVSGLVAQDTLAQQLPVECPEEFWVRGDANSDEYLDISDGIFFLYYVHLGGDAPTCMQRADFNGDNIVNDVDAKGLLDFLFLGNLLPAEPQSGTGVCGNGVLDDGEVCEPITNIPHGFISPFCRGCQPSSQICTDNCTTVGYSMRVHSYPQANWLNNADFIVEGSQWSMWAGCKKDKDFFWHSDKGFCERGRPPICISGGEGTPDCQMGCPQHFGDRNGSTWNFVCK